jgi:hypothetical protein
MHIQWRQSGDVSIHCARARVKQRRSLNILLKAADIDVTYWMWFIALAVTFVRMEGKSVVVWANHKINLYMKNAVLWDFASCGSYKNRGFGGTYRLHHQGDKNRRAR